MKSWAPSIEALEEKIEELQVSVEGTQQFLNQWPKLKQDEVDKAEACLRAITPQWNGMKEKRTKALAQDKEHIEVLKDSIKKLKAAQ